MASALTLVGPPLLINTVSVAGGLLVLVLSRVPSNAWLGLLAACGIAASAAASVLLLPACIRFSERRGASVVARGRLD
jgi:predicted RND superfamily exporter protein